MAENYEKYRAVNSARIFISGFDLTLIILMKVFDPVLIWGGTLHLFFSILWMFLIETDIFKERKYRNSGYIPAFIDISAATIIILMTGNIHSYLNVGYFMITAVSSVQARKTFGLSIAVLCFLQYFVSGLLVYFSIISNVNVFADSTTRITLTSLLIASVWVFIGLFTVHSIIHSFVMKSRDLAEKAEKEREKSEKLLTTIQKELQFAKRIQKKLLPNDMFTYDSLKIRSIYRPMAEVGGDLFDILNLGQGRIRIFLADATGHGVEAALVTMLIKSELEGIKTESESPAALLGTMNDIIHQKYSSLSLFFSCIAADIDLEKQRLIYASAGHPDQYFMSSDSVTALPKTGKLVGVLSSQVYEEKTLDFRPGNRVLLFTDGLFEEFNLHNEEYGEARILSILKENLREDFDTAVRLIEKDLEKFLNSAPIQDDITIIGIQG
ncbi:MAG TPA: PP2C family protein-serine/threonine phosphatase [Leptospiraceae bacterium]|nr:PP2C family protein-serine/threonine phosphatase [Leptospiraceae bacterium]